MADVRLCSVVRRTSRRALALAAVCAALIATSEAAAQSDPSSSPETEASEEFFEVIDVEIVNIDVWVTDRKGDPISDLGSDDFVVLRNGAPVEISNFYAVTDGRAMPGQTRAVAEQIVTPLEARPLEQAEDEQLAPEHRLWLIVYIDNYNLDPVERDRVLPGVREFLARTVRGSDRAMIVTFDRGLEVIQPFTGGGSELFSALDQARGETGYEALRRRQQMQTLQRIDRARSQSQALGWARQYA